MEYWLDKKEMNKMKKYSILQQIGLIFECYVPCLCLFISILTYIVIVIIMHNGSVQAKDDFNIPEISDVYFTKFMTEKVSLKRSWRRKENPCTKERFERQGK
ncbi:putative multidrug resistance-associated protein lethal(2)03659 isoform X1 [Vespula squamosa]|uniref:Multidrug resistance-associated protein lethal(2)03659 isoform X1 n=1 Tax=Vespula squamosa TaxID=30214 RepID=A0ABD2BTQ7_VESSQ